MTEHKHNDREIKCSVSKENPYVEFTLNEVLHAILTHLNCDIVWQNKAVVKPNKQ